MIGYGDPMSDEVWTDEDDAAAFAEGLPDHHPTKFVDALRTVACDERGAKLLPFMVTPESEDQWGGEFQVLRDFLEQPHRISTTPLYGIDAPDVAYVRFVKDSGPWIVEDLDSVEAVAHATLVWRPELPAVVEGGAWRIHALGDPIDPQYVARSAEGTDPRQL